MDSQGRTDQHATTIEQASGKRLEAYIKERWTRREGGIRALAADIGSSTETIYSWFRGDAEPSMAHLRELARALGVRRSDLVAVFDGDGLRPALDPATTESRIRALEAAVALLAHEASGSPREQPAPRHSAGSGR